jgi:coatomer subunit beta'
MYAAAAAVRLENTLNYGMERIWAIGVMKGSNSVAFGFDEGVAVVKIGECNSSSWWRGSADLQVALQVLESCCGNCVTI